MVRSSLRRRLRGCAGTSRLQPTYPAPPAAKENPPGGHQGCYSHYQPTARGHHRHRLRCRGPGCLQLCYPSARGLLPRASAAITAVARVAACRARSGRRSPHNTLKCFLHIHKVDSEAPEPPTQTRARATACWRLGWATWSTTRVERGLRHHITERHSITGALPAQPRVRPLLRPLCARREASAPMWRLGRVTSSCIRAAKKSSRMHHITRMGVTRVAAQQGRAPGSARAPASDRTKRRGPARCSGGGRGGITRGNAAPGGRGARPRPAPCVQGRGHEGDGAARGAPRGGDGGGACKWQCVAGQRGARRGAAGRRAAAAGGRGSPLADPSAARRKRPVASNHG